MKGKFYLLLAGLALFCSSLLFARGSSDKGSQKQAVELTIESWRTDDLAAWEDVILPRFMERHPEIKVKFTPSSSGDYGAVLGTKIKAGTAGDLIMVEPFDWRVPMYDNGDLANLTDLEVMGKFNTIAKSAWQGSNGDYFAVPLASVIHGFAYNKDIFDELGLSVPETIDEFHAVLQAAKQDGKYIPLSMGTGDEWLSSILGFHIIGHGFFKGEQGRLGLVNGTKKFSDPEFVEVFEELKEWTKYMPDGYQAITYGDVQNLFATGRAAVYPMGSWEVGIFKNIIGDLFPYGAFPPPKPTADSDTYFNDHIDMGMAMNSRTAHPDEAKIFLEWLGSVEFSNLLNKSLPGFFALADNDVTVDDPLAAELLSWRKRFDSTYRITYKTLSASEVFNTDNELTNVAAQVMNGKMTPQEAGDYLQKGLSSWYGPQQ